MDEATRSAIWATIDRNLEKLGSSQKTALNATKTVPGEFVWPLRSSKGNSSAGYWVISNFVDQNRSANGLLDYQCSQRTYDGHNGTDIALGVDSWNLMASGQIEVVAAAPGTIVFKQDGFADTSCVNDTTRGAHWNAVYVQHDDGSIIWYGHMKRGSLTAKGLGERVATGEFLGTVGSSGNSSGPHLHFEVYDSRRLLIDPWAGQCNTLNAPAGGAKTWWAAQRPDLDSQINRLLTTNAPPVFATCGGDGYMQTPGNLFEKRDYTPGETVIFMALYRDQPINMATQYRVTRPDGSTYLQWSHAPVNSGATGTVYVSSYWYFTRTLEANAMPGTWMFEATFNGVTTTRSFTVTATGVPPPNYSSLWWNPAESGWGVSIAHQADTLFAAWYTYDTDRSGMWLVMPSTTLQSDGSYAGTIYRTTGIPLAQIDNAPSSTQVTAVGNGSFRFAGAATGTFNTTVNGIAQTRNIVRQTFATLPECRFVTGSRASFTNYQDLWWNPNESGWGISITHQSDILFVAWFTYRSDGQGQWLVGSNVARTPTGTYTGRLYRTTGTPFANINAAVATGSVTDVGDITLTFRDGENADMRYTVDGVTQAKAITRQNWAPLRSACQ